MDDFFQLLVTYQGKTWEFEAHERNCGYVQKVAVMVGSTEVMFEHDEEGCFRALVSPELVDQKDNLLSTGLLQAIALKLE